MTDAVGRAVKPRWLVRPLPRGPAVHRTQALLREHGLHTVCEEARCPNRGECWEKGEATVMILGDTCTRGCRFCHVTTGRPDAPDPFEPVNVARTVTLLGLSYVVITSVDRDDLPDQGAAHWAATVRAVRHANPDTVIDVLTPDFRGADDCLATVVESGAHVLAHNIETVERLHPRVRDKRATYGQSLRVLRRYKELGAPFTKSAIMLGLGETRDEVLTTLADLRNAGVDFVSLGQYLQPSGRHLPVARYVPPDEFEALATRARGMGFRHVVAGPFVRSSYKAWEAEALVRPVVFPTPPPR